MITIAALDAIHVEAERQQVDAAAELRLVRAYAAAYRWAHDGRAEPDRSDVFHLSLIVEPDLGGRLRKTPVTFASGGSAVHPDLVLNAYLGLFPFLPGIRDADIDPWVEQFLEVHPFRDGNGRVAWLIRVWLYAQWDNPAPLPDYFGCPATPPAASAHQEES